MASLSLAFDILARDNASPAFRRVGDAADAAGRKVQGLGGSISGGMDKASKAVAGLGSTFTAAAGLIAGAGIVRGIGAVVSAASDAEQSIGGVQAVFKSYASTVVANSKAADRALGLSANSYRELATVIGSQLKNAQVPLQQVAGQTQSIIQIGADLAAQFGGSTQEAVQALSSAFRGELDPIERYGISLSAARVQAKAVELGLASSTGELSQNAKMMATLALITEQSADAQGAFAREADTSAGRAQRAAAQWENLKVAIGDHLLPAWSSLMDFAGATVIPVMGDVVDAVAGLVGWFADLPGPLQAAAAAGALWAIAGDKIVGALRPMGGLLSGAAGTWRAFAQALSYARANGDGLGTVLRSVGDYAGGRTLDAVKRLGQAIGPELAVAAGAFLITEFVDGIRSLTSASSEAQAAAEGLAGSLTLIDRAADQRAVRGAIEDVDGLVEALDAAGVSSRDAINGLLGQEAAQNQVTHALEVYMATQRTAQTGGDAAKVREALLAYQELATGYGNAAANARFFGEESKGATAGAQASGQAAESTVTQVDEATDAVKRWREQLASVGESFIEPLSVYEGLLAEKTEAEKAQAQNTADATASGKDSWRDYVGTVSVSLDEYATKLEEQLTNQENWRANIVTVSQRGGTEVAQILAGMGEKGAQITAQMATATAEDFERMKNDLIREARLAGQGATDELDQAMKIMAEVGRQGAAATAQSVAQQLGIGVQQVASIAAQYGIKLAAGINPILQGLGKAHIAFTTREGFNAGGGLWSGGYTGDGGKYEPKGIVHGGEFVFTKEQTAKAGVGSLEVWAKMLDGYATGGFVSPESVTRPFSTAPYRLPISTPADATMRREYDETVAWVRANMVASVMSVPVGSIGSGVTRWTSVVLQALAMMGQPSSLLATVLRRMNQESAGNPNAINNWDINAQRGDPSRGLMQTIGSTFNAYHYPGTSFNIYDPLANILASMRYALARYGSLSAAYNRPGGYDGGGWLMPGYTLAYNGTGKPERVRTAEQESALGGGQFTGTLVLDSGQFLGIVHGQIDAYDRSVNNAYIYGGGR